MLVPASGFVQKHPALDGKMELLCRSFSADLAGPSDGDVGNAERQISEMQTRDVSIRSAGTNRTVPHIQVPP